jgi:hypothetical protein
MKLKILMLTAVIISVNVYAINNLWRLNEDGDIIDGPTAYEGYYGIIKVSETGYIYTYDEYYIRCFDSDLNEISSIDQGYGTVSFDVDDVRNEVITDTTIKRYDATLGLIDEFDVPGVLISLTVDPSGDGSIWYTYDDNPLFGLYKITYEGEPIYHFPYPDGFVGILTRVSPDGTFWVTNAAPSYFEDLRLMGPEGEILAEAYVKIRWDVEMYFGDESCWFVSNDPIGISKVNSSGSVVYSNPTDFDRPSHLAVDQDDGSVRIAATYNYDVVHLDGNGGELLRTDWDEELIAIAVDPTNDTGVVISTPAHAVIEPTSIGRIKAVFR